MGSKKILLMLEKYLGRDVNDMAIVTLSFCWGYIELNFVLYKPDTWSLHFFLTTNSHNFALMFKLKGITATVN